MRRVKRLLAILFCVLPAFHADAQQSTLKVEVSLVNVPFTVTDRSGRFIPGLRQEDFAVEEDGRKQEIFRFSKDNELPLTIGMLIDTSASVSGVFQDEKDTAIRFLETVLKSGDLAMVIGFERSVTLVQDYTDDQNKLRKAIRELPLGQGTSVYDAVERVLE